MNTSDCFVSRDLKNATIAKSICSTVINDDIEFLVYINDPNSKNNTTKLKAIYGYIDEAVKNIPSNVKNIFE